MKYIKKLSNLIIFIGVMMIVGTAGASDIGEMTFSEAFSMVLLSFSVITFGRMLKEVSKLKIRKAVCTKNKRIKFFPKGGKVKLEYKKAG